jgi:CRISPR-associated protein Cmr6
MVFDRPNRPNPPQKPSTNHPNSSTQSAVTNLPRKVITAGGGGRGGESGNGGIQGNNESQPSPWLAETPDPDGSASFVEYLRWMRSPDTPYKDPTKVQILQMAEEKADYRDRLTQLTNRTRLIAGKDNYLEVKCPWRIRVGGHRGPESILLPAFDALGMPYIPSSTLRGVARNQAIRHFMTQENLTWEQAERKVAPYFGSLEAKGSDQTGKVIFLDAYPLPNPSLKSGGLSVDMANNIWGWDGNDLKYSPNPNPFFSLIEPTFVIGLRPTTHCNDVTFKQVKAWLLLGLSSGIGSQVNTGYGQLSERSNHTANQNAFFQIDFSLEGQLIHGRQKFTQYTWNDRRGEWQMRGQPQAEVRPVAFKSILRYWFRAFALGVLPLNEVKRLEANLFGSITPQTRGWVTLNIADGKLVRPEARPSKQGQNDPCGEQSGTLSLSLSSQAPRANAQHVQTLFKQLTWMMFHLGGIGQGARRPCYSRQTRGRAPWWRGSTLFPDSHDPFWALADSAQGFQKQFCQNLQLFYNALEDLSGQKFSARSPLVSGQVRRDGWVEAVDASCKIIVCAGVEDYGKPYALQVLHHQDFKVQNRGQNDYDGNLCGQVQGGVKSSPVWIADLGDYQVVTVFGATQNPRKKYVQALRDHSQDFADIFPLQ